MQDQTNPSPPPWGSRAHTVQRAVLLELVLGPDVGGDRVADLAERLEEPAREIAAALTALTAVGLARQAAGLVAASPAARYFEALWPVRP